jgi:hypothetical protein
MVARVAPKGAAGMSIKKLLLAVVMLAAGVAIVLVVLPAMGITIPAAIMQIFWIVLLAVVACLAIIIIFQWWSSIPP